MPVWTFVASGCVLVEKINLGASVTEATEATCPTAVHWEINEQTPEEITGTCQRAEGSATESNIVRRINEVYRVAVNYTFREASRRAIPERKAH